MDPDHMGPGHHTLQQERSLAHLLAVHGHLGALDIAAHLELPHFGGDHLLGQGELDRLELALLDLHLLLGLVVALLLPLHDVGPLRQLSHLDRSVPLGGAVHQDLYPLGLRQHLDGACVGRHGGLVHHQLHGDLGGLAALHHDLLPSRDITIGPNLHHVGASGELIHQSRGGVGFLAVQVHLGAGDVAGDEHRAGLGRLGHQVHHDGAPFGLLDIDPLLHRLEAVLGNLHQVSPLEQGHGHRHLAHFLAVHLHRRARHLAAGGRLNGEGGRLRLLLQGEGEG